MTTSTQHKIDPEATASFVADLTTIIDRLESGCDPRDAAGLLLIAQQKHWTVRGVDDLSFSVSWLLGGCDPAQVPQELHEIVKSASRGIQHGDNGQVEAPMKTQIGPANTPYFGALLDLLRTPGEHQDATQAKIVESINAMLGSMIRRPSRLASIDIDDLSAVVHDVVVQTMRSHTMSNMVYAEDGLNEPYRLIDLLSAEGETIASGEKEIELIGDAIYNSFRDRMVAPAIDYDDQVVDADATSEQTGSETHE
jgi:hypothetical protein